MTKEVKKQKPGRKPNLLAVQLAKELIIKKKLTYRDAGLIIAKKLGVKSVDTKSMYRWVRY